VTVAFDNTFLSALLNPNDRARLQPETGKPLDFCKERAEAVVAKVEKERRKIILPAPAVSELLTAIGPDAQQYLNVVGRSRVFDVGAFDARGAAELALLNRSIFAASDAKHRLDTWQKRKVDRQIIAICKVYGATELYTDDDGLANRARLCGITPVSLFDIPVPEKVRQINLDLEPHDELPEAENDEGPDTKPD